MNLGLVIYLINILGNLDNIIVLTILLISVGVLSLMMMRFLEPVEYTVFECIKDFNIKKILKIYITIIIILGTITSLIPEKDDMYKILLASKIGTTNEAVEKTKQIIDYIVEKVEEIK